MSMGIGKRILKLREKRGWTLAELSNLSGIKAQTISAIELGKSPNPTVKIIERLSNIFDVSTDYIILGKSMKISDLEVIELPSAKIYVEKVPIDLSKEK